MGFYNDYDYEFNNERIVLSFKKKKQPNSRPGKINGF